MRKLHKSHLEHKVGLLNKARSTTNALQQAAIRSTQGLAADDRDYLRARDLYNQVVDEINAFIQAVTSEQEAYFESRSEGWQESETGQAHQDWQSEWDIEIDACELDAEDLVESGDLDAADCLANLPDEP